ncbi:MAG: peptide transporter, partial [Thermoprotei archaeon]
TGNTVRAQIAALLQNWWSRLGFRVVVETYTWPVYLDKVDKFDFDVSILGWIPDYLDPDNYLTPFVWGGGEFKELKYYKNVAAEDVGKYISKVERFVETEKFIVVIGPKGTGATFTPPTTEKPILVVSYVLDEEATKKNWENPVAMVTVGAPNWRDIPVSALVKLSQQVLDPEAREAVIQAAVIIFNNECPMIMLGQAVTGENHGSWVKDVYYPLTLFMRYDLVWETSDAPVVDTGVLGIKNDPKTLVITTFGWPDSLDPAKSYESFGWEIFHQIYDTLVTYWKEETEPIPDLAVAWAFSKDETEVYFVMRGDVKAYDPWNDKLYDIDATDALFSIWRVARLRLDPSWMIYQFIDVNASTVLTESELDDILKTEGLVAVYKGEMKEVRSLDELLSFFDYKGPTAGVVKFKLYFPYAPIIHVFVTKVASIIPMEYALGDKYDEALAASNNGRDPSVWANYVGIGETDETHKLIHEYPVGTGPYYVADYKEDAYILLKINPYYWNAALWEEIFGYKPSS